MKAGTKAGGLVWDLNRPGIDDDKALKGFIHLIMEEAFELVTDERSDAYPYEFESAFEELEYQRRDGFIPYSENKGGAQITVFETVPLIMGSGSYPASVAAQNQITSGHEDNRELALQDLGLSDKTELTEQQSEALYEKQDVYGADDTIMFQVTVYYHGTERGVHSATVQVLVNWEWPYHRSQSAVSRCLGRASGPTEEFIETTVRWRTNRSGRPKILAAIKNGIKKLF